MNTNRITSKHTAIVNGKPTGLAACADGDACPRTATCLRTHPKLTGYVARFLQPDASCKHFIPRPTEQT